MPGQIPGKPKQRWWRPSFHAHKGRLRLSAAVTCVLRNEGHGLNHKTVQKLMMAQQLKSLVRRKKVSFL
ncbi:IS3 family transposase [Serratia marcescens]|uniref:IS3 family transposase n=1 Tax=Serratia marcescens TaxID=615 RepID=UPI003C12C344